MRSSHFSLRRKSRLIGPMETLNSILPRRELALHAFIQEPSILTVMDLITRAKDLATNPHNTKWTTPLQLLGDAILCGLIVWKIPCTSSIDPFKPQCL